jgi:HK97 family phage prohead protease
MSELVVNTRGHVGELCVRRSSDWAVQGVEMCDLRVRIDQAADGSGAFEGWGCVYGVQDTYGTTFQQGSFTEGGLDEAAYAYLAMHSPMLPLGTFVAEDRAEGLWIAGEYDPTPVAQDWRARALTGSAPELSVGFVWLGDGGEDDPNLITSARLVETSQIVLRMASVPGAQLLAVKATDMPDALTRARANALLALRLQEV